MQWTWGSCFPKIVLCVLNITSWHFLFDQLCAVQFPRLIYGWCSVGWEAWFRIQAMCLARKESVPVVFMEGRVWPRGLPCSAVEDTALDQGWPGKLGKVFQRAQKPEPWWFGYTETNYFNDVISWVVFLWLDIHTQVCMIMYIDLLFWKIVKSVKVQSCNELARPHHLASLITNSRPSFICNQCYFEANSKYCIILT